MKSLNFETNEAYIACDFEETFDRTHFNEYLKNTEIHDMTEYLETLVPVYRASHTDFVKRPY
jgi:hypothetical protein